MHGARVGDVHCTQHLEGARLTRTNCRFIIGRKKIKETKKDRQRGKIKR